MAHSLAETFMQALQTSEQQMDPTPVAALFGEEAELRNLAQREPFHGQAGAETFWRNYLSVFQQIRSEFTNVIETEESAVLEWTADGTLASGHPIQYRGVSIVEGAKERVRSFRTYYDSATFLPQGAKQHA